MIAEAILGLVLTAKPEVAQMPPLTRYAVVGDNHRGYEPSAYRGKWFDRKTEPIRKCIGTRESHFQYMMSNGGAYQFMASSRWPISLTWMLKPEARQMFGKKQANRMQRELRERPVNQWSRYWQDAAFWVVWRHGAGRHHWDPVVAGTGCF